MRRGFLLSEELGQKDGSKRPRKTALGPLQDERSDRFGRFQRSYDQASGLRYGRLGLGDASTEWEIPGIASTGSVGSTTGSSNTSSGQHSSASHSTSSTLSSPIRKAVRSSSKLSHLPVTTKPWITRLDDMDTSSNFKSRQARSWKTSNTLTPGQSTVDSQNSNSTTNTPLHIMVGVEPPGAAAPSTSIPAQSHAAASPSSTQTTPSFMKDSSGIQPSSPQRPYQNVPVQPNKTAGVPKGGLHALYGKAPRRKVLSAESYHSWHDGGPPHRLQWSSIFVCPLTGELFLTGQYVGKTHNEKDGLIWYNKKTDAEHGAAARALDCLTYRDSLDYSDPSGPKQVLPFAKIGGDEPYLYAPFTEVPEAVPVDVRDRIRQQQASIRHSNPKALTDQPLSSPPIVAQSPIEHPHHLQSEKEQQHSLPNQSPPVAAQAPIQPPQHHDQQQQLMPPSVTYETATSSSFSALTVGTSAFDEMPPPVSRTPTHCNMNLEGLPLKGIVDFNRTQLAKNNPWGSTLETGLMKMPTTATDSSHPAQRIPGTDLTYKTFPGTLRTESENASGQYVDASDDDEEQAWHK